MLIEKCFECKYPTKDRWAVVPNGRLLPLCLLCRGKIPKEKTRFELLIEADEALKPRSERPPGRPKRWSETTSKAALGLLNGGLGVSEIAAKLGFSYATTWKYLRKHNLLK